MKMKRKNGKVLLVAICLFIAFTVWTVLICFVDVRTIGPIGSRVGFATLNSFVHSLTGVNMTLYTVTDWLGLVPAAFALGFAAFGIYQSILRKSVFKVDRDIITLGVFYILVAAVYVLFEVIPVNYRPVLIDGHLEVSYPSSTTVLVMCVMLAAVIQLNTRIKNRVLRQVGVTVICLFTAFMVVGRMLSGVHWFTDIVGGILISLCLVMTYAFMTKIEFKNRERET